MGKLKTLTALLIGGLLIVPQVPKLTTSRIAHRPDATPFQSAAPVVNAMRTVSAAQQRIGGTFAQAAQNISNEVEKNQIEENERIASEADIAFTKQRRQILFGSDDGKTPGFYSLNNRDAVNAAPGVKAQIEKLQKGIAERLDNPAVRVMFDKVSMTRINSETQDMDRFTIKQQKGAQIIAATARRDEAVQDAIGGRHSPSMLIASAATIRGEVFKQSDLEGWDDVTTQRMLQAETSEMYSKVIDAMLRNGEYGDARVILDRVTNGELGSFQMDPGVAALAEDKVSSGTMLGQAQTLTDTVRASGATPAEQRKAIRDGEFDPQVKKLALADLSIRGAEDVVEAKAAKAARESAVTQYISQGGKLYDYLKVNPGQASAILSDDKFMKRMDAHTKAVKEGRTFADVDDIDLTAKLAHTTPTQLAQMEPTQFASSLTPETYGKLVKRIEGAVASLDADNESFEVYNGAKTQMKDAFKRSGFKWDSKDEDERAFQSVVVNEMNAWIAAQPERPDADAVITEVERLITEIQQPDQLRAYGLWEAMGLPDFVSFASGERMTIAEMQETGNIELYNTAIVPIDDLSPGQQADARAAFSNVGAAEPGDQLIEQFWGAYLTNNKKRQAELLGVTPRQATKIETLPIPRTGNAADTQFKKTLGTKTLGAIAPTVPEDQGETVAAPLTEAAPEQTPSAKPRPDIPQPTATAANIVTEDADIKKYAPLLDALGGIEGGVEGFEALAGGGRIEGITTMTIADVAKKAGKRAVGMWQNLGDQIEARAKKIGLDPETDTYSPENQAKIAMHLLKEKRGVTDEMIKNDPDEAINRMAKEWAAVPVAKAVKRGDKTIEVGESYYKDVSSNKALITVEALKKILKQISEE